MRVLHLTTSFPRDDRDYSGLFVYRLVRSLHRLGVDCRVLTPAHVARGTFPEDVPTSRFRYAPRPWQILGESPGGIPQALKTAPKLAGLLPSLLGSFLFHIVKYARDAEVIHAHWSICGALAAMARPFHRKPVVTTLRGSDMDRAAGDRAYASIHRMGVFGSDIITGVSRQMTEELITSCPTLTERVHFVPNGVDDRFYEVMPALRPLPPPLRLLFAGSLIALKGLDVLIRALGRLKEKNHWTLTVAGDGDERERIEALSTELGIRDRVFWSGRVIPDGMAEVMGKHHALILPSKREGRPNVVLEAMAAGLAVIATDISGVRELVQDGVTGFLVPPGDDELLAAALERVLRKPELLQSLGASGRKRMVDEGLTWEATALNYLDIYEKLVRSCPRPLS